MPKTDTTPAVLDAAAAYFRDACDGPDGAADACERAAAICRAVGDPAFLEALTDHAAKLQDVVDHLEAKYPDSWRIAHANRHRHAVCRVLGLVVAKGANHAE